MATIFAFRTLCLSLLWISFLSVIVVLHLSRQELKTPAMEGIKRIASYLGPKEEPPVLSETKNTSKYIMYQCQGRDLCGGLADRFKMVINAYAWSLFTNRKLIIDISKPCNFINLMVPNEVDWNLNITQLVENGDLPKKYKHFIIGKMDNGGFKNDLSKIDLFSYKEEADILTLHSNLEWISGYVRNGFLIDAGFITPDMLHFSRAFNKWFNKLFNLNPNVEEKFQEYLKKAKPTNRSKLICTQVRIGGSRPNVSYDQSITPRNFTVFYWDFIKNTFIKNMTDEKFDDYKIFVTGDTKSAVDEARDALGADRVLTIDGHYPHMDREFNYKDNCRRFEKVIMDFYMLGYCDLALVSDSGFGIFGLLRNRIPERDFYVLSALMRTGKSKHTILPLKRFLYLNPHRY